MTRRGALLRLLADGEAHAAEDLAGALGVTRAALATLVDDLDPWGVDVASVPNLGYRLRSPLDLLDRAALEAALAPGTRARAATLEVHEELASTNAQLLARSDLTAGHWHACLAEFQSAGRGRRGRGWIQPFGSGLCLSFAWLFPEPPAALGTLSLAAGVAAVRALDRLGVTGLALKWPNDVLRNGGKLGGILSELRLEAAGPAYVVIGIGLNVRLASRARESIIADGGVRPADLADLAAPPSRTRLAAALIDAFTEAALRFEREGFAPFLAEWIAADALQDRPVEVHRHDRVDSGTARGITPEGALRIEIAGRIDEVTAGEVSLRRAGACC